MCVKSKIKVFVYGWRQQQQLDMCLWNMDAPGSNKVKILQNLEVLHFDPIHPLGTCDVSEV